MSGKRIRLLLKSLQFDKLPCWQHRPYNRRRTSSVQRAADPHGTPDGAESLLAGRWCQADSRRAAAPGRSAGDADGMPCAVGYSRAENTKGQWQTFCAIQPNRKTRKPSIEAGIRRNAIYYSTWNEINAWDTAIALQKQLSCRSRSRQPCHHVSPTNQTSFNLSVAI